MKSNLLLMMLAAASAQRNGVTLYEHADFNGNPSVGWSGWLGPGMHTGDFPNDVVTSYKIDDACCGTFFEHYDFKGNSFAECGPTQGNVPDNWNDVISSVKVSCNDDYGSGATRLDADTIQKLVALRMKQQQAAMERLGGHEAMGGGDDEVEIWELVPGYIVFVMLWIYLLYPPIQDIVLFCFYAVYDFGSSIDIYVEDHETGWTVWAIAQGAMSIGTMGFYLYLILARYAFDMQTFTDPIHVAGFMIVNAANLLVPFSKYILIWYESELEWGDCGVFDCFFALDSYVGQLNLEVEMYPDIAKAAALASNFLVFLLFPWVDDWMQGKLEF